MLLCKKLCNPADYLLIEELLGSFLPRFQSKHRETLQCVLCVFSGIQTLEEHLDKLLGELLILRVNLQESWA